MWVYTKFSELLEYKREIERKTYYAVPLWGVVVISVQYSSKLSQTPTVASSEVPERQIQLHKSSYYKLIIKHYMINIDDTSRIFPSYKDTQEDHFSYYIPKQEKFENLFINFFFFLSYRHFIGFNKIFS